jgi:hypothetical protein
MKPIPFRFPQYTEILFSLLQTRGFILQLFLDNLKQIKKHSYKQVDLKEDVDSNLTQNRIWWRALVNTVMNLPVA